MEMNVLNISKKESDNIPNTCKNNNCTAELSLPEKEGSDLRKPLTVCFVCSGNTCRSPMAAAVLNHFGKGKYRAFSAGLSASDGDPISEEAVNALREAGIENTPQNDYVSHKAVFVNPEMLERCDKIIAVSKNHMLALIYTFPQLAEKISVMSQDIPDPFMRGAEVYKDCLSKIIACIKEMFNL